MPVYRDRWTEFCGLAVVLVSGVLSFWVGGGLGGICVSTYWNDMATILSTSL